MKTRLTPHLLAALLGVVFTAELNAQTTAFTYQGRLNSNGAPYTGSAEFQPTLWSAASGGGSPIVSNSPVQISVGVTNGLFTLPLDFGGDFPGADRWLQLEVRTTNGVFSPLLPRQQITPTPYAITAGGVSGPVPATQLSGTLNSANLSGAYGNTLAFGNAGNSFGGSGAGLTALNASQLTSGTVPDALLSANVARTDEVWLLGGNAGTTAGTQFVGTTDDQPFELRVNNQRAFRVEPTTNQATVNVIGGSPHNFVAPGVAGATIGGGAGEFNGVLHTNSVAGNFGTIGGGRVNTIQTSAADATIAGGSLNTIQTDAFNATIGGGYFNTIRTNATSATISGGHRNVIQTSASSAAIGGGYFNTIQPSASYATIGGGLQNTIQSNATSATIGGGSLNKIQTNGFGATIGGGAENTIQTNTFEATIGGGFLNTIQTDTSVATIGGGYGNTIQAKSDQATIGGGRDNIIQTNADFATIPGGQDNSAASYAFAAGRRAKANHIGAFVWADATAADFSSTGTNQFLIRAGGGVGINQNNPATALDVNGIITASGFSGGGASLASLNASALTSGTVSDVRLSANVARTSQVWLLGGNAGTTAGSQFVGTTDNQPFELRVNGQRALRVEPTANTDTVNVIGGSARNFVAPGVVGATIGGGGGIIGGNSTSNTVMGSFGTIGGGQENMIQTFASFSTIGGGYHNTIQTNATYATIPGGLENSAASYAFAAGYRAKANHLGAFVWADAINADFSSTGNNQFLIRAGGGVGINQNNPATALDVNGTITSSSLVSYGASGDNLKFRKTGNPSASNPQFVFSHRPTGTELWLYGYNGSTYRNLQGWDNANNTVRFPADGDTLYINQANARVGIGRAPTVNALEVNGNASKTTAGSWLANSDARIKRDIAPVTDALDRLDKVRLVSFRYTEDYRQQHPSVEDRRYLNVVAQEFAEVFPDDVKSSGEKTADGHPILQVDTYPLTIYAAAAVQELNRKLETQLQAKDAELQALKASVAELQTAVRRLTQTAH